MTSKITEEFQWDNGEDAFPLDHAPLTEDRRTEARICAVQALYQALMTRRDALDIQKEFELKRLKARKADKKLFALVIGEASAGHNRLETLMKSGLREDWPWERIDAVLKALGWAAAAELTANADTPVAVILNEYINISKGFLPEDQVKFAHVWLDGMAQKIRGPKAPK